MQLELCRSINVLPGIDDDSRTPDRLVDGVNETEDGAHMWLTPLLTGTFNFVIPVGWTSYLYCLCLSSDRVYPWSRFFLDLIRILSPFLHQALSLASTLSSTHLGRCRWSSCGITRNDEVMIEAWRSSPSPSMICSSSTESSTPSPKGTTNSEGKVREKGLIIIVN